jgi:serine/threonine protein kinase
MGEVHTARRFGFGGAAKLVAIKSLLPEKASDPSARRMFLDEARLSMLLTNSNIVQVFDVDVTNDGTCYMAMELVDGMDLAKLTERLGAAGEKLSPSVIAYIIGEVFKALVYAHEFVHEGTQRSIIHRDISPHNVMLSVHGEVKLMDFGVARLAAEETSGMFVKGKIRYMPPEQFEGESRDPTIDLFAVGAILHELLDGKKFRGGILDEARLMGMGVRGDVPPLTCRPEDVPAEFERLRQGLLARLAKDRIPSARMAHRLLSQWPGDRDAKFELEEIVRRFVSVTPASASVSEPVQGSDTDLARELSNASQTREPTAALLASPGPNASVGSSNHLKALGSVLAVGLGLGVIGTGAALGWWKNEVPELAQPEPQVVDREPPPLVAATTRTEISEPQPAARAAEASKPEELDPVASLADAREALTNANPSQAYELAKTAHDLDKSSEALDLMGAAACQMGSESKARSAYKQMSREQKDDLIEICTPLGIALVNTRVSPTSVIISAAAAWTQIKIAGKEYTIDRLKGAKSVSAKIKPGDYAVLFRADPEAGWVSGGKVTIPKSGPVKLAIEAGKAAIVD